MIDQIDGSRDTQLCLKIYVPHFSKPEQDMASAQHILHQIRTSIHAEAEAHLLVGTGRWQAVIVDGDGKWWQ